MPHQIELRGRVHTFECYGFHEAKSLGLIDSEHVDGTHAPVSTPFYQGEGDLLSSWLSQIPDAILIEQGRGRVVVYRPKGLLRRVRPEPEDEE